jgi:hypothetical protein
MKKNEDNRGTDRKDKRREGSRSRRENIEEMGGEMREQKKGDTGVGQKEDKI